MCGRSNFFFVTNILLSYYTGVCLSKSTVQRGSRIKSHAWVQSSIVGWMSTVGKWVRILGECMIVWRSQSFMREGRGKEKPRFSRIAPAPRDPSAHSSCRCPWVEAVGIVVVRGSVVSWRGVAV